MGSSVSRARKSRSQSTLAGGSSLTPGLTQSVVPTSSPPTVPKSDALISAADSTPSAASTAPPGVIPSGAGALPLRTSSSALTPPPESTPTTISSPIIYGTTTGVYVEAPDGDVQRSDWFHSEPLDRAALDCLQAVQLHTVSHDQGWVSDPNAGSWSWFELVVQRWDTVRSQWYFPLDSQTEQPHRFLSHKNPIAQGGPTNSSGAVFNRSHGIWQLLEPGDRLLVVACAQFCGWSNTGVSARLEFS